MVIIRVVTKTLDMLVKGYLTGALIDNKLYIVFLVIIGMLRDFLPI